MTLEISISGTAPQDLVDLTESLAPEVLQHAAGKGVTRLLTDYFRGLDSSHANDMGGKRTHYYAQAARSVFYTITDDGVVVSVNQLGLALHYYGGTVTPTAGHKYLTIPVDPSAYGHRASEFDNLEFQWGLTRGGKPRPMFLVEKSDWKFKVTRNRTTGSKQVTGAEHNAGKIMYYLALSATLDPNPDLLPSEDLIAQTALTAMTRQVTARIHS